MRGTSGPETVDIELRGLDPGKHYTFIQFADPPPSATVTLTESGPVVDYYSVKVKPPKDFLGPRQGLEDQGSGTLSVSQRGKSGSLKVTLPKDDSISGHWTCGTRQRTGPPSRPALYPATVPPVVNECAIGTLNGPTPPPISCPNCDLNVNAWGDSANLSRAGRSASLAKVGPTSAAITGHSSRAARPPLPFPWPPSTPSRPSTTAGGFHRPRPR